MTKFAQMGLVAVVGCLVFGGVFLSSLESLDARPQYVKAVKAKYEDVAKKKCGVCHPEKSKKVRSEFGKVFGKALGGKNVKDSDKVAEALEKAAAEKDGDGKTYGEILGAGEVPK